MFRIELCHCQTFNPLIFHFVSALSVTSGRCGAGNWEFWCWMNCQHDLLSVQRYSINARVFQFDTHLFWLCAVLGGFWLFNGFSKQLGTKIQPDSSGQEPVPLTSDMFFRSDWSQFEKRVWLLLLLLSEKWNSHIYFQVWWDVRLMRPGHTTHCDFKSFPLSSSSVCWLIFWQKPSIFYSFSSVLFFCFSCSLATTRGWPSAACSFICFDLQFGYKSSYLFFSLVTLRVFHIIFNCQNTQIKPFFM